MHWLWISQGSMLHVTTKVFITVVSKKVSKQWMFSCISILRKDECYSCPFCTWGHPLTAFSLDLPHPESTRSCSRMFSLPDYLLHFIHYLPNPTCHVYCHYGLTHQVAKRHISVHSLLVFQWDDRENWEKIIMYRIMELIVWLVLEGTSRIIKF